MAVKLYPRYNFAWKSHAKLFWGIILQGVYFWLLHRTLCDAQRNHTNRWHFNMAAPHHCRPPGRMYFLNTSTNQIDSARVSCEHATAIVLLFALDLLYSVAYLHFVGAPFLEKKLELRPTFTLVQSATGGVSTSVITPVILVFRCNTKDLWWSIA